MTPLVRPGTLFYRSACPRCRGVSLLVVLATAGRIARAPMDSAAARTVFAACPECRGRPALWDGRELTTGAQARRRGLRLALGLAPVRAGGPGGSRWSRRYR